MSKKSNPKKSAPKSTKKTTPKKTHLTMAERADAAARMAEALEAQDGLKRVAPEEFVGKTRAFAGAWLPPKKTTKKADTPKAEKAPRVTVTSVSEDLIRAGKTNEEILEALVRQFPDFDPIKKKHYPQWYRARLARNEK